MNRLHLVMGRITHYAAALFIIFGSGILLTTLTLHTLVATNPVSLVGNTLSSSLDNQIIDTVITPTLSFISEPPASTMERFAIEVSAVEVTHVRMIVRGITTLASVNLAPVSVDGTTYRFVVPVSQLQAGDYQLAVTGQQVDGTKLSVRGSHFTVSTHTDESNVTEVIPETSAVQQDSLDTTEVNTITENAPIVDDVVSDNDDTTTKDNSQFDAPLDTAVDEARSIVEPALGITLRLPVNQLAQGELVVSIEVTRRVDEVDLYAQATAGGDEKYIGSARRINDRQWMMPFDTTNLPNGLYQLQARVTVGGVERRSTRLLTAIQNPQPITRVDNRELIDTTEATVAPRRPTEAPKTDLSQRIDQSTAAQAFINNNEDAVASTTSSQFANDVRFVSSVDLIVRRVLQENQPQINQTIRDFITTTDVEELTIPADLLPLVESITLEILRDRRLRNMSSEVEILITQEITQLVGRAVQLEQKLARLSSVTGDAEVTLQELLDEVQIPESAVADIKSPREFGLVRDDILGVTSVEPIITVDQSDNRSVVFTEITGRALPDSLVTLFIFSSPVVVTITAEADGTFSYVYEKELEDGKHEVYVALTNTAGAVVAKSNGFEFTKQAQAFTVTDDVSGDTLVPTANDRGVNVMSYITVLAISSVALGLLLLLLGHRARPATVVIHENI